jgi:hypothetical protein
MMLKNEHQASFGLIKLFLALIVVALIGYTGWYVWQTNLKIKVDTYWNSRTVEEKACLENFYKLKKADPSAFIKPCVNALGNQIF